MRGHNICFYWEIKNYLWIIFNTPSYLELCNISCSIFDVQVNGVFEDEDEESDETTEDEVSSDSDSDSEGKGENVTNLMFSFHSIWNKCTIKPVLSKYQGKFTNCFFKAGSCLLQVNLY